jgi:hypothetical protein
MDRATFNALVAFPEQIEMHFAAVPAEFINWAPPSWEGVPSEPFTAIEQVCHVRDIEIDGYHVRIRRILSEINPTLESIDSESLAKQRSYATSSAAEAFAVFRAARAKTIGLISALNAAQFSRTGVFEGYGSFLFAASYITCAATTNSTWPVCNGSSARLKPPAQERATLVFDYRSELVKDPMAADREPMTLLG